MSGIRMSLLEPLRIDQAKSIQGIEYTASQGVHTSIIGMSGGVEGCEIDTL